MNDPNQHTVTLHFERTEKRESAPIYKFSTVTEMFAFLTPENIDRFLADFCDDMKFSVLLRAALDDAEMEEKITLCQITWIDDEII